MAHHIQDEVILATVTLEEEIMDMVEAAEEGAMSSHAWDLLLRSNL